MFLQILLFLALSLHKSEITDGAIIQNVVEPQVYPVLFEPTNNQNNFKIRKRYMLYFADEIKQEDVCQEEESDFPHFLTDEQLKNGGIILCILIGIYCFTFLAILCDKYFLPCVEHFCETFSITQDVAGATFLAMATTAPEFFINVIGTFITESDIGIGTVVGSNLYNTLAVAALGSLAAATPIKLDWWPVTRDCFIYICTIGLLVGITWDGKIYWYKSIIMAIAMVVYFAIMFNSKRIERLVKKYCSKDEDGLSKTSEITLEISPEHEKITDEEETGSLFTIPQGGFWTKFWFFYSWPIKFFLWLLVPNPTKNSKLYILTFLLCIILIGLNSYVISWMLSLLGDIAGIPDSVLGLTFLAFGGGLPESLTIIILSRKGEGSIGVSNALGANTMNTLMSLGLPWCIKNIVLGFNDHNYIEIESGTISFTILALLLVVTILYLTLYFNKFYLSKSIGIVLSIAYVTLLSLAVVSEVLLLKTTITC